MTGISGAADRKGWAASIFVGLTLFVGLCLARAIVVDGLGDGLTTSNPQFALSLGRDSPDVLTGVADKRLQAKDYKGAGGLAFAALDRSPLNVNAMRAWGAALEGLGRSQQARTLIQFAGTRSWRDNQVQVWLLRDALIRRQIAEAFLHADALVRRREELRPAIFLLFEFAIADADASRALAARLALLPPWREPFLEDLARSSQKDILVSRLFQTIDNGPAPLSVSELGDYVGRLAREGRYRDAFLALKSSRNGRAMAQTPFDGDFANRQGVAPFAWERVEKAGVTIDFAPAPGRSGQTALRVDYDGFSSTHLLRQAMALAPGSYRLTGEIYPEAGDTGQLYWEVRCIAGGQKLASVSPGADPLSTWRSFAMTFTIPPTGCDGAWLALSGAPGDHRSSILGWYDKIRIAGPSLTSGAAEGAGNGDASRP